MSGRDTERLIAMPAKELERLLASGTPLAPEAIGFDACLLPGGYHIEIAIRQALSGRVSTLREREVRRDAAFLRSIGIQS